LNPKSIAHRIYRPLFVAAALALCACSDASDRDLDATMQQATSGPTLEALTTAGDTIELHVASDPTNRDLHVWQWPDGRLVVTLTTDTSDDDAYAHDLTTYDLSGNQLTQVLIPENGRSGSGTAIGGFYLTYNQNGVSIFDLRTGRARFLSYPDQSALGGHYDVAPPVFAFASGAHSYAAFAWTTKLLIIDLDSGNVAFEIDLGAVDYYEYAVHPLESMSFHQDGKDFAILTTERTEPDPQQPEHENLLVNLTDGTLAVRRKALDDADWFDAVAIFQCGVDGMGWPDRPMTTYQGRASFFYWNLHHAELVEPMTLERLALYERKLDFE
jgi:hypothetical protein